MSSNYPPGVTGLELHIAGPSWEGTVERACEIPEAEIDVIAPRMRWACEQFKAAIRRAETGEEAHPWELSSDEASKQITTMIMNGEVYETVIVSNCPFEGEVEAVRSNPHSSHVCCDQSRSISSLRISAALGASL